MRLPNAELIQLTEKTLGLYDITDITMLTTCKNYQLLI